MERNILTLSSKTSTTCSTRLLATGVSSLAALIKHTVCLVEDEIVYRRKIARALIDKIDNTTRCTNNDVGFCLLKRLDLFLLPDASKNGYTGNTS